MGKIRKPDGNTFSPIEQVDLARGMVLILQERTKASVGGVVAEITWHEALLRQALRDAMGGNASARRDVIELARIGDEANRGLLNLGW